MQPFIVDLPRGSLAETNGDRESFDAQLLAIIPQLRAFARFLAPSPSEADDLVQDTIIRALKSYRQFDPQTNIKAWCFTILRNLRITAFRKRTDVAIDDDMLAVMSTGPQQEHSLELKHALKALETLPASQRDVIILVRAGGLSYEEAAAVMGCRLGTIKSRLNRADAALRTVLGPEFRADDRPKRSGT